MWLDRIPASVAFCDVETTGLAKDDRIVSFGGIGMISSEFAKGRLHLAYMYLVFDPGKRNSRGAEQVHGFSDWVLAVQDPFEVHAAQVWVSSRPTKFSLPTTLPSTSDSSITR